MTAGTWSPALWGMLPTPEQSNGVGGAGIGALAHCWEGCQGEDTGLHPALPCTLYYSPSWSLGLGAGSLALL